MTISEAALQKALHQMEQVLLELVRSEDAPWQGKYVQGSLRKLFRS